MKTSPQLHSADFTCKLTSPELSQRKQTVIRELKKQVIESRETTSGFAYKFGGSNTVIDSLLEFVKSERQCCPFLTFNLSFGSNSEAIWLELNGPEGVKEFIRTELEF